MHVEALLGAFSISLFLYRLQIYAHVSLLLCLQHSSLSYTTGHWLKHSIIDKVLQFAVWGEDNVAQTLKLHLVAVQ